jgi:hypothetical protein
MKPRKPAPHLTPLERMFQHHKPGCTVHLYSADVRRCSCGRDEAEKQYRRMLELIQQAQVPMFAPADGG